MAKARPMSVSPVVRSVARTGVRNGLSDPEIVGNVLSHFPTLEESSAEAVVKSERQRQDAVDAIMSADKRVRVDLARRLKCPPGTKRIRMRITITWVDPATGETRTFGHTVETDARGRLSDLLNAAIGRVMAEARAKGYKPSDISSAMTGGRTFFRIEYAECV